MIPDFNIASDYGSLSFKKGSFYYGYGHSICANCGKLTPEGSEYCGECEDSDRYWCFTANIDGIEDIVIPFNKLGAKDMFSIAECLLVGIGWVLTKYNLTLNT